MEQKKLLTNVAVIRPILIVLLVFYHAFAPIDGFPEVTAYWWLDWLSYAFMLEMFVFVSGYVFGYQVRTKGPSKLEAKSLLWGKFKRLMIPCMVFSLLYILLYGDIAQPFYKTVYDLFNGVGHMWFLPMLFWCFVGVWIIEKLHIKAKLVFPALVLCSICSHLPLPLRIENAMYYMLFFYVGYYLQKEDVPLDRFYTPKHCIFSIIAFCVLFPTLTLLKRNVGNVSSELCLIESQPINWVMIHALSNMLSIIYSSVGLVMLFIVVGVIEKKRTNPLALWVVNVGGYCMGVYLFQQFILKALYYYSSLPSLFGHYWLPWFGFAIALVVSLLLSFLFRKTSVGRLLIG